jgi:hypothetical protein
LSRGSQSQTRNGLDDSNKDRMYNLEATSCTLDA